MSAQSVARSHQQARARLARLARQAAAQLWGRVDPEDIAVSWERLLPRLVAAVTAGQEAAAGTAEPYLKDVLAAQDIRPMPVDLNRRAFAGVASDGRDLQTLLRQPVITTKVALLNGATPARALASGQAALEMIAGTQVADAGRVADGVALTSQPEVGYVRMVVGGTCSRCLILAGRRYQWNRGFNRHPNCDCIHIPVAESGDDLRTNPRKAFNAMTREQQDRVFTKAGAEAIRDGADMARVVNARRGMYTAGGRQFTTQAARRRDRLMPEQIYLEARGNRTEAIRLLRLHGYIL